MSDTKELKQIKRIYGEKFKNLCREMFPVILEQEGTLLTILEKRFSHNCNSLYETITGEHLEVEFKDYIYSEFYQDREKEEPEELEDRTPYEILDEAGYDLYECKTEEDIQCFKKFYAPNEVLCTIYNGGRLDTRDCFFAVRKDVGEIKRSDFTHPAKTDKYSLSVLGIQFTREKNSKVEIISRYNHTVNNPNCTLGNDLDRLAPRLKQSFAKLLEERGLDLDLSQSKGTIEFPGYTLANDGRYYKYNMEVNGIYYCPGNIVISNGEAKQVIAPEKGIVIDNFCLDLENKEIREIYEGRVYDSFVDGIRDIEKIETEKIKDNKGRVIKIHLRGKEEPVIIGIDRDNQIIRYENQYLQEVGDKFLCGNIKLTEINMPNLQQVGRGFLAYNRRLTEISLPKLQQVGDSFLSSNTGLAEINMPKLQQVGDSFLYENRGLIAINLPELRQVENNFLKENIRLAEINLPELQRVGNGFLSWNRELTEINVPKLQQVGDSFLRDNTALAAINVPELQQVGDDFLYSNIGLTGKNMPKLQQVGDNFLYSNTRLTETNMPKLQRVGDYFLYKNQRLTEISLPKLQQVGNDFLFFNSEIAKINMPNLQQVGDNFLRFNTRLTEINMPELQQVGSDFLRANTTLARSQLTEVEKRIKSDVSEKQKATDKIAPTDIARLDQKNHITRSAIKKARELIQKLKEKVFGKEGQER